MCKNINKISCILKKYLIQHLRANIKDIYVQDVRDGLNRDSLSFFFYGSMSEWFNHPNHPSATGSVNPEISHNVKP